MAEENKDKKLKKLLNYREDKDLAVFDELQEINEALEELPAVLEKIPDLSDAEKIKGEKGDKGDKGDQGEKGDTGPQGAASTVAGPQGPIGETGPQGPEGPPGPQGERGEKGEQGASGSPDTAIEIRDKLVELEGDDRVPISAIKGLEFLVKKADFDRAIGILDQRTQFLVNKQSSAGATAFTGLSDVPSSYSGQGGKGVRVNAGATALEFYTISAGGTVTSVASADGSITVTNPTTTPDLAVVSAPKWTTARTLAGNSVDGSANVAFANKVIVQGTVDAGLSAAQFLGALGTGIIKNTTTTGVLSIAIAADFPTLNQNTTGSAATLTTARTIGGVSFDGSANITVASATGGFTVSGGNLALGTNSLTLTGSIGATGARVTKGWFTDIESTNAIVASITGSAPTLTTARAIYGNNFDGSAALTQVIASTYGGTGNGFTKFSGPTTAEKTFTLPDASATILTSAAAVTVAQGGSGATTLTGILKGNGTSAFTAVTAPSGALVGDTDTQTLSGKTLTAPKFADLGYIADANGNELIILDTVTSAVNELTFANAATGNPILFTATGGDTNVSGKFVPKGTGSFFGTQEVIVVAISDETTAITTGTAKVTFHMPYAFSLMKVKGGLSTASSSGNPAFDLNDDGVSVFSTTLTIDANETFSDTAATASVLTSTPLAIASGSVMTIDIDTAGTGAKGAKLYLIGYATAAA